MDAAQILHREANLAVIQLPGRRFPALAMQGDTLFILVDGLRRALAHDDEQGRREEVAHVLSELEAALGVYVDILNANKIPLPW